MGQRVQHSARCMLTESCSKAVFTVTMKSCLTSIIFVILVCRVGANFPCKPKQIHWNTTVGKRPKCFDCPDCLPGTEPSIPCGTSVYDRPEIHCVLCKLGKTYSDKDDTSHCKACTICSKGKAVKNKCTLTANTECDNKCGPGFYTVRLISGCFPCTRCCGDGKDEFAAECANNMKKCKVRYTPCTRFQTTPSKPTKRNYSTSNTSPAVQKAGERTTMGVNEQEKSVSGELSISITPTSALDNEMPEDEIVQSGKQDGTSIVVILLIITVALCMVLSISIIAKRVMSIRNMLQSSREQDSNNEGCNISQGGTPPLPHLSARSSQDSSTPLLNRSESPQQHGSASPQHMSSTPVQTNGSASPQRMSSTPVQTNGAVSPQRMSSTPVETNGAVSPQHMSSTPVETNGAASPQRMSSTPLETNGAVSPQRMSSTPVQTNGSASPQHMSSTPVQTNGAASPQRMPSTPVQTNGPASPQHMSSIPVQTNGAVSSQPNESESPEPGDSQSTSLHSSVSVSSPPYGCTLTHSNQSATAAAQSNRSTQEQVKPYPDDVTLEELEEKHFPVFERMCKDLNNKRPGEWWDFERLASCYAKISLTDRKALKNEFQDRGGIPSDALMSHIKTKYPDHSVRHLVGNLQSIGRNDIALRLMPYTLRKPSSTQGY